MKAVPPTRTGPPSMPLFCKIAWHTKVHKFRNGSSLARLRSSAVKTSPRCSSSNPPHSTRAVQTATRPARSIGQQGGQDQVNHLPRCPAMVFDIHFSSDGLPAYRVLTTRQSVRVPGSVWKSWAGTRVSVLLYAAQLADNEIVSAVGQSDSREVLVAP